MPVAFFQILHSTFTDNSNKIMLQVQIVVSIKYGRQIQQMGKETLHLQGADEMKIIYKEIKKN